MIRRFMLIFASAIFLAVFALWWILFISFLGPSPSVRDQLTLSMLETSALKFVPRLFLPDALINEIMEYNRVVETSAVTDTSLVTVSVTTFKPQQVFLENRDEEDENSTTDEWAGYPEGIRVETVKGAHFRGYVLLIRDPSRVYTAVSSNFKGKSPGLRITDAMKKEGAAAAINGGGFPDNNGVGEGNVPTGIVFSKGEHLWGAENTVYSGVIGFDANHVLVLGSFSPKQAKEMGIRDAINFGPVLVLNGEPAEIKGFGGGLNPRSAIGQRADGTVLFLCVDGRMPSSLGANYRDLINIMLDYGAINAANLDGGSSSNLLYNGEIINISSSLYGPRKIPTFFMVKPLE